MDKVRNLYRYWIDKDSQIVVRKWTDKEYKNINPHTHIFEKYWSYSCPICSFIPTPHDSKESAEHGANTHWLYTGNKHKCVVEYRLHELVCLECKEEFLESLNVWVAKQEIY